MTDNFNELRNEEKKEGMNMENKKTNINLSHAFDLAEEKRQLTRDAIIMAVAFVFALFVIGGLGMDFDFENVLVAFGFSLYLYIPLRLRQEMHAGLLLSILIVLGYYLAAVWAVDTIGEWTALFFYGLPLFLMGKHIYLIHKYSQDDVTQEV